MLDQKARVFEVKKGPRKRDQMLARSRSKGEAQLEEEGRRSNPPPKRLGSEILRFGDGERGTEIWGQSGGRKTSFPGTLGGETTAVDFMEGLGSMFLLHKIEFGPSDCLSSFLYLFYLFIWGEEFESRERVRLVTRRS